MKILFRLLACAALAFGAGCATRPAVTPAASAGPAPLLLVSIDAFRADYLQRGLTPTLAMLAADGVRAEGMQPSFPSLTFPNHYTLVTGLRPDHHGIVNNTMLDPVLGRFSLDDRQAVSDGRWWAGGTPIWETADAHGLRTATMFWPGAEADIHGRHPDYWRPYDGKIPPQQRVAQVLAWLDLPPAERPRFITLYFDDVDHAGHAYGPDAPQVDAALRTVDAAMAQLVQGLRARGLLDRINLIVLADHGMAAVPADHSIAIEKLIPLDQVQVVSTGVLAGFNPAPGHDFAAIERRMEQPQRHMQCWDKTRVPARLEYGRNPRVPQLLCLADVGWRITTPDFLAAKARKHESLSLGEHGYDNADPRMRALFLAHGPAFREGAVVPVFPNVDVYPLMTHLLGLPAAANDGDFGAAEAMLKSGAR
ncbi:ectonucleotide pyrophosphatase/phosphodiesterase [Fulvimonas soli]|jgi:predicted AlkP superfamily pyrophosphatase or phosphodiesterase|uniref:Putative AlkP superfamily pyrophosphatase or phosphodiesterase n=1 Tax=Fulvimonas soli TaxID=155197 RepID=A0A316IDE9_9GAMM|nr:ectonucleotide pyrophosphatase/phosphodiesterase [Fulvimonas soli]PWK85291.1 putative AlkP superfamily pyrophosphatase or phosphodiesterase [Fulvimonas soli]TNY26284.1 alkaline phosphatase family protein [Fulvimonas soli]